MHFRTRKQSLSKDFYLFFSNYYCYCSSSSPTKVNASTQIIVIYTKSLGGKNHIRRKPINCILQERLNSEKDKRIFPLLTTKFYFPSCKMCYHYVKCFINYCNPINSLHGEEALVLYRRGK